MIDLAWMNSEAVEIFDNLSVQHNISASDHFPVTISLSTLLREPATMVCTYRWYSQYEGEFREFMRSRELNCLAAGPEEILAEFYNNIGSFAREHNLIKTHSRGDCFWNDSEYKELRRLVRQLLSACKRTGFNDPTLLANWIQAKSQLPKLKKAKIREAVDRRIQVVSKSGDSKTF